MNMMNKCAKFHKDSPSGKKVKFNLARAIELSETGRFCVQLWIETLGKRATSVAHLTNFSFEFFLWNFHRRCLSTYSIPWCRKSQKWPKTQIKGGGGPALTLSGIFWRIWCEEDSCEGQTVEPARPQRTKSSKVCRKRRGRSTYLESREQWPTFQWQLFGKARLRWIWLKDPN